MKERLKFIHYIVLAYFYFFISSFSVEAVTGANFTVNPLFGKEQTDDQLGYFSILVNETKNFPIKVSIKNMDEQEDAIFSVQIVPATTTNNGKIDYTPSSKKGKFDNTVSIQDFLPNDKKEQRVLVKANDSKEVTVNLTKPVDEIEGTVLGSIYVKKIPKYEEQMEETGIKNTFAMSVPIMISEDFNKKMTPKLSLDDVKVELQMGQPKIGGEISNNSPVMFGDIIIDAWVTKKNETHKLYEQRDTNYEMAPHSSLNYKIDINNELLKTGEYTYHIKLKSGDKTFNMSQNFKIKSSEFQTKSEQLPTNIKGKNYIVWIILMLLFLMFILFCVFYYIKIYKTKSSKKISNNDFKKEK